MKNVFRIPPKMKAEKMVPGLDFEVWRQRCSQGGPKGSPRHPPGPNPSKKDTKMEGKMETRIAWSDTKIC